MIASEARAMMAKSIEYRDKILKEVEREIAVQAKQGLASARYTFKGSDHMELREYVKGELIIRGFEAGSNEVEKDYMRSIWIRW